MRVCFFLFFNFFCFIIIIIIIIIIVIIISFCLPVIVRTIFLTRWKIVNVTRILERYIGRVGEGLLRIRISSP